MVLSAHYVVGIATIPYSLELVARYIYRDYDAEQAGELERRLLNSIRTQEPEKFKRGVRRMRSED